MNFTTKFKFNDVVFPVGFDYDYEKFRVGMKFLVNEIEVRIFEDKIENEFLVDSFGNTYDASECFYTEKDAIEFANESNQ